MKRKMLPAIITLAADAVTAILSRVKGFKLSSMLIALLAVTIVFYFFGTIIRRILDSYDVENQKKVSEEGEVIEKENVDEMEDVDGESEEIPE